MTALTRNQLIASAAGTLEVLEALSRAEGPSSLSEVARATGRPKGTVHRMLATLVNTGFASYHAESSRYAVTLKAWRIGSVALRDFDLVNLARPTMEKLSAHTGETVHLSVLEPSGEIVYVAKVVSPKSIGVQTRLGQLSPSWCTATGRALLAYHPNVAARVLKGIKQAEADGYAVMRGENHPEMGGVASPVWSHDLRAVASVGVAMPVYRMGAQVIKNLIPAVQAAARQISQDIGFITR